MTGTDRPRQQQQAAQLTREGNEHAGTYWIRRVSAWQPTGSLTPQKAYELLTEAGGSAEWLLSRNDREVR